MYSTDTKNFTDTNTGVPLLEIYGVMILEIYGVMILTL